MNLQYIKTASMSAAMSIFAATTALAGDTSTLNVLGFSNDGGVFVFEEYGVQDGSGFPYANRFYIDTSTNQFLSGSPIRVRMDDENADLADVRAQAKTQGDAIISEADLVPAFAAAVNSVTETSSGRHRIAGLPRAVFPPFDDELEFRLTEVPFTPSGICEGIQEQSYGFKLVQIATTPDQSARLIHEDMSVPASRSCPSGYFLAGIYTHYVDNSDPTYAVIIGIESFGFEGPDYRWMAVTGMNSVASAK